MVWADIPKSRCSANDHEMMVPRAGARAAGDIPKFFGVQSLGEGGRALKVAEHDDELAPFGFGGRYRGGLGICTLNF